jgi:hypothetical protein
VLIEGGANPEVVRAYSAVIRRVARFSDADLASGDRKSSAKTRALDPKTLARLSLDEIQRLIDDDSTPRSTLEAIAIGRFDVPKGSMRSFSNIEQLRGKILTSIQNERTHEAIRSLARKGRSES